MTAGARMTPTAAQAVDLREMTLPAPTSYHRWLGWHATALRRLAAATWIGIAAGLILGAIVPWHVALLGAWNGGRGTAGGVTASGARSPGRPGVTVTTASASLATAAGPQLTKLTSSR